MSGKKSVVGKVEAEESSQVAVEFFTSDLKHEDVLKMLDNDKMVWPF
jgi:hypothetical protein